MKKYYTRACNFVYGKSSIKLVSKKKNLPLNGNRELSFNQIEIITRNLKKTINLKDIKKLPKLLREKVYKDLKIITKKNNNFSNFNFKKIPNIMGILNLTPDSFSDGGKFNKKKAGVNHAINLFKFGADIIDVGGESTRPGSKSISEKEEWSRIKKVLTEKIDDLHKLAKALLTYETLSGEEIENLINKNIYPNNKEDLKVEDEDKGSALSSMGLKPKIIH